MKREYWSPEYLVKAAQLLTDAARQVQTSYPHSSKNPCSETLPAAKAMIKAALDCIERAQPGEVK